MTILPLARTNNHPCAPSLAHCWGDKASTDAEWNKDYDEPAFTTEARPGYEARTYAPSTWACTNMTVDTAADPLAGLEDQDFTKLMQSKRYKKKVPSSKMFWRLFRYIGGMNEGESKDSPPYLAHCVQETL